MNAAEHRAAAEEQVEWLENNATPEDVTAVAILALVHATLAAIPDAQTERADHAAQVAAQERYELAGGYRPHPEHYAGEHA